MPNGVYSFHCWRMVRVAASCMGPFLSGRPGSVWNTAWTNRQPPHTLGILCDPQHPVFRDFPTEYHSNWQWWDLVTKSQIMVLNDLPSQIRPLIRVIDDWNTCRRLGLLLEARVGNGRLLMCSIDLKTDIDQRPVARQLKHSLLQYMASNNFNPKHKISIEQLKHFVLTQ